MTTRTLRRVPFTEKFEPAQLDYQDGLVLHSVSPTRYELNKVQRAFTTRKAISRCGQAGHRCNNLLCSVCSTALASQRARDLRESLRYVDGTILLWTATIPRSSSRSFAAAREDLLRAIQRTSAGRWLQRRGVIGTARAIEHEHELGTDGWHIHAHTILVFRNELESGEIEQLREDLRNRYVSKAQQLGIDPSLSAQDVEIFTKQGAIGYVTKDATKWDGENTSSRLWQRAAVGDADALDLIHELEHGTFRKRSWTLTGVCKFREHEDLDDLIGWGMI